MKILYLHQHFTTREEFGGTRSYEFARFLGEQGHEVTIVCGRTGASDLPPKTTHKIEEHTQDGLKILKLNVLYSQKMGFLRRLLAFAWFMILGSWVAVKQREIDIIFATSTPLTIAIPAIIASRINKLPFVFEVRDLWPEVPVGLGILCNRTLIILARRLEHLAYSCATHIIACSPGMKEGIVRAGIQAERVSIIPNACDNDLFDVADDVGMRFRRKYPFLMNRPIVLYAGALGMVNGLTYLVRLAAQVHGQDQRIAFLLLGNGKEKETISKLAQDLGVLNKNLWLLDAIPRKHMPEALSAATIATSTVLPNPVLWNNSANKFFDALAAGRPIAINHGGWQADLLQESGAGIVLPSSDLDKAGNILVDFLRSKERIERARKAAKILARDQFARKKLAGEFEQVLLRAAHP